MFRFILIAFLAFTANGHASVTAAWKVPIENFAPDHENSDKVRKLDKPPGESGFFKAGDELWDVAKTLATGSSWQMGPSEEAGRKLPWAGEWAVWNARSGMLVARGDYIDIIEAQQASGYDRSPRMIRISFELLRGARKQSVSVLAESGEQGSAKIDDIILETDALTDNMTGFHEIRCAFSWNAGQKDLRRSVHTSFVVRDGKRLLVARHGNGDSAWELHVTAVGEIIGGTPVGEARWIEIGKKRPRPWPDGKMLLPRLARQPLKDGLFIAAYQVPPPFGSGPPPPQTPDMEAPATLRRWIHGSFLNVAEVLKGAGMDNAIPGFFAGVELRSNQLILVADAASHDRIPELLEAFAPPPPVLQIESRPESGNCLLLVRSGFKALIDLEKGELGEETRELFQIEPTLTAEKAMVDLNYEYSRPENPGEFIEGTANLKVGEWQEVEGASQPNEEPRFALRATVLGP